MTTMSSNDEPATVDQLRRSLAEALDRIRLLDAELERANHSAEQARAIAGRLADLHHPAPIHETVDDTGAGEPVEEPDEVDPHEVAKAAYLCSLERELAAMQATKTFRYAAPFRRVYARIRTSGSHRRS